MARAPSTGELVAYSGLGLAAVVGLMWWTRGPSPYFTWDELTKTSSLEPNELTTQAKVSLHRLVWTVLHPLRREFGVLRINSAYRNLAVNTDIGGSSTSSHMALLPGEAAVDVQPADPSRGNNWDVVNWLWENGQNMNLDQVIGYTDRSHAHIGIGPRNRGQFLSHTGGTYTTWSPTNV